MRYMSMWDDVKECCPIEKELDHGNRVTYKKGQRILRQEEMVRYIYYIYQGRVKVILLSVRGSEKIISIHEAGSFIGEASFLKAGNSIASIYADEDTCLLPIGTREFQTILHRHPDISFAIFQCMAQKIELLAMQVEQSTFFEIKERLAGLLVMLMEKFGVPDRAGQIKLSKTFTDQEIGNLLGVRREMITKQMIKLREQGIVRKENFYIHIIKPERLYDMAEMN